MRKTFFYYLLSESRRERQKYSKDLFDEIWKFIDSDNGQEALHKFSKTKLPRYTDIPIASYYEQPRKVF